MIIKIGKSLIKASEKVILTTHKEKPEYIVVRWKNGNQVQEEAIEVQKNRFKRADRFKYPGNIITLDNDIKAEISMGLQSANKGFNGLSNIFCLREVKSQRI